MVKNYQERLYWHVRGMVGVHEDADEVLWVLLRFKRGRWYIVEKVFFTTEATWVDWAKYFRAPPAIFPKLNID